MCIDSPCRKHTIQAKHLQCIKRDLIGITLIFYQVRIELKSFMLFGGHYGLYMGQNAHNKLQQWSARPIDLDIKT